VIHEPGDEDELDGDELDGDDEEGGDDDETDETYDPDELDAAEEEDAAPKKKRPRVPLGPPLTGKQRRYLRSLGHSLEPLVQLGKHGLTPGVVEAIDEALARHELVKVRLGTECPDDRDDVADKLGPALSAHVAQTIGRTILVYRRHPQKPVIHLPKA
jgi:RNA-binding protein